MSASLLTRSEMVRLNNALARATGGRFSVGPAPVTLTEARLIWRGAAALARANARGTSPGNSRAEPQSTPIRTAPVSGDNSFVPLADRSLSPPSLRRPTGSRKAAHLPRPARLGLALVLGGSAALSGCATLGGHVSGNFACSAPGGSCAPTSKIDDQALAMIETGGITPAGPFEQTAPETGLRTTALHMGDHTVLGRSGEKVVRIVFPPYVDAQGRFHEESAVQTVVERSAWAQSTPLGTRAGERQILGFGDDGAQGQSLSELASAAPEASFPDTQTRNEVGVADADLPDPGAIEAARMLGEKGHLAQARGHMVPKSSHRRYGARQFGHEENSLAGQTQTARSGEIPKRHGQGQAPASNATPTAVVSPVLRQTGFEVQGGGAPVSGSVPAVSPVAGQGRPFVVKAGSLASPATGTTPFTAKPGIGSPLTTNKIRAQVEAKLRALPKNPSAKPLALLPENAGQSTFGGRPSVTAAPLEVLGKVSANSGAYGPPAESVLAKSAATPSTLSNRPSLFPPISGEGNDQ